MEVEQRDIRLAAMNLLAMREHSSSELREKLLRKFSLPSGIDAAGIDAVIESLNNQGLVSDKRFAESFVSMRFRQLKGPLLIALELKAKGVDSVLVETCLKECGLDWVNAAQRLRQKKFGATNPMDARERSKQARYLQARGFSVEQIRSAFVDNHSV